MIIARLWEKLRELLYIKPRDESEKSCGKCGMCRHICTVLGNEAPDKSRRPEE